MTITKTFTEFNSDHSIVRQIEMYFRVLEDLSLSIWNTSSLTFFKKAHNTNEQQMKEVLFVNLMGIDRNIEIN